MKTFLYLNKLSDFIQRFPKWAKALAGLVIVILGFSILFQPFSSLTVMIILIALALVVDGLSKLTNKSETGTEKLSSYFGLALVLGGILVLVWPHITIKAIAIIVGISLLVSGLTDILTAFKGTRQHRITPAIKGLAVVIFGVLALAWQDVAILVIAVAFSIKLVIMGITLFAHTIWKTDTKKRETKRFVRIKQIASFSGAVLLLIFALGLLSISHTLRSTAPQPDSFYTYNEKIPSEPGKLLKVEPYHQAVPSGVRGWRILYSTTRDETGTPAVASAFVMAPKAVNDQPQPVVAWAHGTTGVVPGCAPTVMKEPFPLDNTVPAVSEAFANGWVIVGTDYAGLGTESPHPYLIGQGEARSVLNSVRAAKQIKDLKLADKTVVWGHSQGGHAALWTGGLADSYAPDVHVIGIAAAAPASNPPALVERIQESPIGKIMGSFALRAYSEAYPDVSFNEYTKPSVNLIARRMSGRCLATKSTLVSILQSLAIPGSIFRKDPTTGALGERLKQNIPTKLISVPVFIAQGEKDDLVFPDVQAKYVADRCAAGQKLEYKTYPGKDHVGVVDNNTAYNKDLEKWTQDRFDGVDAKNTCR